MALNNAPQNRTIRRRITSDPLSVRHIVLRTCYDSPDGVLLRSVGNTRT
jgi:hypothetical protein